MSFITSLGDWLRKITRSFTSASISGRNITLTRHNGDTVVLTTQDTVNNAFTKIKLGTVTLEPDAVNDTLTLGVGAGIQLSANATNDSITVSGIEATQSLAGIMSITDKTKLDGIATGAEVNQNAFSNVKVGSTTIAADGKTDTIELVAGTGITLTPDAANDKVTVAVTSGTYAAASHTHPYIPTAGGDITGAITQTSASTATLKFTDTTGRVTIGGGTAYNTGAYIWLYGKDHTSEPGCFDIDANNGTTYSRLHGTPDGALTWKGESILNQNAFSNVKVGATTVAADSKTDTLEFVAGSNVTLTPDASDGKITIAATDTVYTHPTTAGNKHIPSGGSTYDSLIWSASGTAQWGYPKRITTQSASTNVSRHVFFAYDGDDNRVVYNDKFQYNPSTDSLTVGKINGFTLGKSVPSDAVFTDTTYTVASATPEPVTAVGAVGTSTKYAREDHIHARRCAHVGQSGSSTTNPWFKFATFTINANWMGNETTFLVTGPYLDRYGILVARFLSNGSAVCSSSSLKWLVVHRIDVNNFVFVVGADNKTLELWAKCASGYERYTFTVLSESSRGGPQALWTLLTSVSAGEAASPTAGTQTASTLEGTVAQASSASTASNGAFLGYDVGTTYNFYATQICGYITNNSKTVRMLIPLTARPPIDKSWTITFSTLEFRTVSGNLIDATNLSKTITCAMANTGLRVEILFESALSEATNNSPIGINLNGTFKAS